MNKGFFAILLLAALLLPMYANLRRIRRLPQRMDTPPLPGAQAQPDAQTHSDIQPHDPPEPR